MQTPTTKTNILHTVLATLIMTITWMMSAGIFMSLFGAELAEVEPGDSTIGALMLLLASFLNILVVVWFVNLTRLSGLRLALQVFLMVFGVMFFMTQIETLFFNTAVQMPWQVLAGTVASGFVTGLVVSIMAVWLRHRLGRPATWNVEVNRTHNAFKLAMLAVIYMIFYFVFGYYTAWQVPELRAFYSGSTDIIPFFQHMRNVLLSDTSLPFFQIVRGLMWAGIGYAVIAALGRTSLRERALVVGLVLSVGLSTPLFIPNEYMPGIVRMGHFFELLIENFLFGVLVALFFRPVQRAK